MDGFNYCLILGENIFYGDGLRQIMSPDNFQSRDQILHIRSNLVIAHPGWITVTEISALKIPAIYVLSSKKEYHEWDELIRLETLGLETDVGLNVTNIVKVAEKILEHKGYIQKYSNDCSVIAPWANGAEKAANIIQGIVR